jgi:diguanylate cyclase (GGDEF)-like protein
MKKKHIKEIVSHIDYAFQPITTLKGETFAVEALIRGTEKAGFETIQDFFDFLVENDALFQAELLLREKVFQKFTAIKCYKKLKLFYNYDVRVLNMPDYTVGNTEKLLSSCGIKSEALCLEVTEKNEFDFSDSIFFVKERAGFSGFKFAIDDFGVANSNFYSLYFIQPDFIKIDRFFIHNIHEDNKKKLMCRKIIELASILGATVIAEGVEDIKEYYILKNIGIGGLQGYLIQKPEMSPESIKEKYDLLYQLYESDKRANEKGILKKLINGELKIIEPLNIEQDILDVFSRFRTISAYDIYPVVDSNFYPLGVVKEKDLRNFTYSPFGKELLSNKSYKKFVRDFTHNYPVVDIDSNIDNLLDTYSLDYDSEGLIVKKDNKYFGFLDAKSIIKIVTEARILEARDLNPLTKLPGNSVISAKIEEAFKDEESYNYIIYYDFDNFKPFNDRFGFRLGDRLINSFAEILKNENHFEKLTGHIGGDDFIEILSFKEPNCEKVYNYAKNIRDKLKDIAASFYTSEERQSGFYVAKDRDLKIKRFPLIDLSCSILEIPDKKISYNELEFSTIIGTLKKSSKQIDEKVCFVTITGK